MASHNTTLHLIASKLGLSEDDKVLGKAAEFERLLQTRTVAGSNLSDTSKVVICLDLAAGLLGADLDLKSAIKYAGLKPTMYNNSKKMIQNLLELDSTKLTTSILCAALQCTGVQGLADRILEEYQKQAKMEIDLNLPQYVCMAVFHACRISKVKVSKVKINEKSRLKPAQWAKLDADWSKFVDENFAGPTKRRGRLPKNAENIDHEPMDIDIPQKEDPTETEIEPYEDWKRRMLETAYKELRELEKLEAKNKNQSIDIENQRSAKKSVRIDSEKVNSVKKDLRIDVEKVDVKNKSSKYDIEMVNIAKKSLKIELEKVDATNKNTTKPNANKKIIKVDTDRFDTEEDDYKIDKEVMTPRRSPRKTPQKYSPYKNPTKGKGVRLLFDV